MRFNFNWLTLLLNGFLLAVLGGLFAVYLLVVSTLPGQIYSAEQEDYLSYNSGRGIMQAPPTLNFVEFSTTPPAGGANAPVNTTDVLSTQPANFSVWRNRLTATLNSRYEEQSGVSVTLYDLDFQSQYHLKYPSTAVTTTLELIFPFPSNLETLHEVRFLVDGKEPLNVQYTPQQIRWLAPMTPGLEHDLLISYQADGAGRFSYGLNQDRRTDALEAVITIQGLTGSTTPQYALTTTSVDSLETGGEVFTWHYTNLVANRNIQLELPKRLSFAQRVAALQDDFMVLASLAPFLVGLFIVTLFGLFRLGQIELPIASYLLSGVGMALFYPLLTFLSGLVDGIIAAFIALAIVTALLIGFLGLSVGWRAATWRLAWLLFIFLGLFSMGLLTPFPGLLFTFGGLLLVGTFMLLYALQPKPTRPTPPATPTPAPVSSPAPVVAPTYRTYCPQCGRGQANDYQFCPGCGYDTQTVQHCATCHHEQVIPADTSKSETVYCLHCGTPFKH